MDMYIYVGFCKPDQYKMSLSSSSSSNPKKRKHSEPLSSLSAGYGCGMAKQLASMRLRIERLAKEVSGFPAQLEYTWPPRMTKEELLAEEKHTVSTAESLSSDLQRRQQQQRTTLDPEDVDLNGDSMEFLDSTETKLSPDRHFRINRQLKVALEGLRRYPNISPSTLAPRFIQPLDPETIAVLVTLLNGGHPLPCDRQLAIGLIDMWQRLGNLPSEIYALNKHFVDSTNATFTELQNLRSAQVRQRNRQPPPQQFRPLDVGQILRDLNTAVMASMASSSSSSTH
jgi:hypothetical protein